MARKTIQSRLRLIVMACHFDVCYTKRQFELAFFITTGKLPFQPAFFADFIIALDNECWFCNFRISPCIRH